MITLLIYIDIFSEFTPLTYDLIYGPDDTFDYVHNSVNSVIIYLSHPES